MCDLRRTGLRTNQGNVDARRTGQAEACIAHAPTYVDRGRAKTGAGRNLREILVHYQATPEFKCTQIEGDCRIRVEATI